MSADGQAKGPKPTRREALVGIVASAAGVAGCQVAAAAGRPEARGPAARRWGMTIDLDRCLRCHGCVVACAAENNVAPLGPEVAASTRPIHWMDMLASDDKSSRPEIGARLTPIPCMHCQQPACVKVCPVGATYQTDDGIVAQIWDRCIGCRYCMVACPYARRYFNWTRPVWPGNDTSGLNPDVALRLLGVVEKCTFCSHKIRAVFEKAKVDEQPVTAEKLERLPACAASCPVRAIAFGDLFDPTSVVAQQAKSPRARVLLESLNTGPKVFYLQGKG